MPERKPIDDPEARQAAADRHDALARGAAVLPNLFLRSIFTLTALYGILGLVLITIVQVGYLTPALAVGLGVFIIVLQFVIGPWLMDLSLWLVYKREWVEPDELPGHLRRFVEEVCDRHGFRFPWFAILDDGAPEAYTYGHYPGNARIVISRGLIEILSPEELEAVVAHELGHVRNWDMLLMTVANLVPLLLYYVYDLTIRYGTRGGDKAKAPAWAIAIGAYVLYVVSQYIVLWFSRTREYHADRFSGKETGNPAALARALVKIAYGLADPDRTGVPETEEQKKQTVRQGKAVGGGPFGALNIFDRTSALNLVMTAGGRSGGTADVERVKGAMQWDLWNPWAMYFELHSTHPLTAKRLLALSDQAASLGQAPYVVFDRKKPESYWDEFAVDVAVMLLPTVLLLAGVAAGVAGLVFVGQSLLWVFGVAVFLWGAGLLVRYSFTYPRSGFEHETVETLLQRVKVSPVRPVPAILKGTIIGKGVPGLVYSEDFVMRDKTGIIFLDYQQPLWIWNLLFGLLRAGRFQGEEVRVRGWFRRAPVPYLEIDSLEVAGEGRRRCYTSYATLAAAVVVMLLGAAATVALAVMV